MSEIQLNWPNKDRTLIASGDTEYEWVQLEDQRLTVPPLTAILATAPRKTIRNVLAIGDGLDVIEALRGSVDYFRGGIRLVYIDPPFNPNSEVERNFGAGGWQNSLDKSSVDRHPIQRVNQLRRG